MRTLRVTVPSAVARTSLVCRELGLSAVLVHGDEVDSAVQPTRKLGDVNVECEFLVEEAEHLVIVLVLHEVHTGTDVLLLGLGHEFECESVATGCDTISAGVVCTVEGAIRGTGGVVGAEGGIPGVSGVAVVRAGCAVKPAPVSV